MALEKPATSNVEHFGGRGERGWSGGGWAPLRAVDRWNGWNWGYGWRWGDGWNWGNWGPGWGRNNALYYGAGYSPFWYDYLTYPWYGYNAYYDYYDYPYYPWRWSGWAPAAWNYYWWPEGFGEGKSLLGWIIFIIIVIAIVIALKKNGYLDA